VLNGVTPDSDILADTVNDYGPCLNDEGETDAQVRCRVRPCNLFPHLRVRPAKYPAGWTRCRSGLCVRSLMLRAYNRNGDGRLWGENATPNSFPAVDRPARRTVPGTGMSPRITLESYRCRGKLPSRSLPPHGFPMMSVSFPRFSIRGDEDAWWRHWWRV